MRFGRLLDRAFRVTWRQKRLWVLGILIAGYGNGRWSGGSGGGDAGGAVGAAAGGPGGAAAGSAAHADAGHAVASWLADPQPALVALLVVVALALALGLLVLQAAAEAGLIAAVADAGAARTARLGETFRRGLRHVWPVLGIKLLAGLVAMGSIAALASPAVLLHFAGGPLWSVVLLAVVDLLVLVPWLVSLYAAYQWALRVAVLEGAGVRAAAARGWRRLHGRLLDALLMLLAEGLGLLVGGVAGVLVILPVALIAVGAGVLLDLWPVGVAIGVLLVLPLGLALAGALGTWRSSVWTLGILDEAPGA